MNASLFQTHWNNEAFIRFRWDVAPQTAIGSRTSEMPWAICLLPTLMS